MSVGFIGAGQLAHALVRGFTAAGELSIILYHVCAVCMYNIQISLVVLMYVDCNQILKRYFGVFPPSRCDCHPQNHSQFPRHRSPYSTGTAGG